MSRKKTSRSSLARRGSVRLGWRKKRALAVKYEIERMKRMQEIGLEVTA